MSEKVDLKEVLEGLDTDLRKSRDGEIHVYLTSAFEPQLSCGKSDVEVRVLTLEASKTLLERLNAEIRVPCRQEVVWGNNGWCTTPISHVHPRICKKKPEPEYRVLEPGEPAMPGDILFSSADDNLGECSNHYKHRFPNTQNNSCSRYKRKPWTKEEYLKRQAEWVKFHNLKVGDTVKVCCAALDSQDGWGNTWEHPMTGLIDETTMVTEINHNIKLFIPEDRSSLGFPFYVLQVVKKPEPVKPKYREFRTPQEVLAWVQEHGQIVVNDRGHWSTVTRASVSGDGQLYMAGVYGVGPISSLKSLKDGTPFGVPE